MRRGGRACANVACRLRQGGVLRGSASAAPRARAHALQHDRVPGPDHTPPPAKHPPQSECGGVPLFVSILRDPERPAAQAQAMAVIGALAASPSAQGDIAAAGGLPALAALLAEPLPRTQVGPGGGPSGAASRARRTRRTSSRPGQGVLVIAAASGPRRHAPELLSQRHPQPRAPPKSPPPSPPLPPHGS